MKLPTSERPMATSYETIWLDARRPPRSENWLFDDQPARAAPITPAPATANT